MSAIRIDIADLETILAVAQHGNFHTAADALHVTQSSVSARVKHAEDLLGVKLFNRTTRKVTITRHGERLCNRAGQALVEIRSLITEFKDEAQLNRGRVILGTTPMIAAAVVPSVVRRFLVKYPGIEVMLRDDFYGGALERVDSGEVDFAIAPIPKVADRFNCELVYTDELLLLVPAGHELAKRSRVSVSTVSKYPLICMPPQSAMFALIERGFSAEGAEFRPAFRTQHMMSVVSMVTEGFGIGFVTKRLLPRLNMKSLCVVRVGRQGLFGKVGIITARGHAIQPAAEHLIAAFREFGRQQIDNSGL